MNEEKLVFKTVQDLLESLQDSKCTFMFVSSDNRFMMKGDATELIAHIVFAMCRYKVIEEVIKTCASNFDDLNKKYGDVVRATELEHLIMKFKEHKE